MKDHGRAAGRAHAIVARKKIALDQFNLCIHNELARDAFEPGGVAGWPGKAAQIAKPEIQKAPYDLRTDKTTSSGYHDQVVRADDSIGALQGAIRIVVGAERPRDLVGIHQSQDLPLA